MDKRKQIYFQDIDMSQNKIESVSSVNGNENTKIDFNASSLEASSDNVKILAQTESSIKIGNSANPQLYVDSGNFDIESGNISAKGILKVNDTCEFNSTSLNLKKTNIDINNSISGVSEDNSVIVTSADSTNADGKSYIKSCVGETTVETRSPKFIVDGKINIEYDSNTGSLTFVKIVE